ncbi:MAG TPA: hypothetical protein VF136_12240 [Methylomirabilota bacterium]
MRVWLVAAGLALGLAAPAAGPPEYDLSWTASARQAGWQGEDARPVAAGERSGTAVARLVRVGPRVVRLEWQGPEGNGRGLLGPAGPSDFHFPSPLEITGPPALPHLSGGTFEFSGDPQQPDSFTVSYVEGFICRSTPAACDGVAMWERRLEASARRR